MSISTGLVMLAGMLLILLAYRFGVRDGQRLAQGKEVKVQPVVSAVNAVKAVATAKTEVKASKDIAQTIEGMKNIMSYDGQKQG